MIEQLEEVLENLNQIKIYLEEAKSSQWIKILEIQAILKNWQRADHIRLHAGEMTAQEMRSVKAVVRAIEANINRVIDKEIRYFGEIPL
jgi:hypothetical protein